MKPFIHYDRIRKIKGKQHYFAEITKNAGTHGIYLDKKKADNGDFEAWSLAKQK